MSTSTYRVKIALVSGDTWTVDVVSNSKEESIQEALSYYETSGTRSWLGQTPKDSEHITRKIYKK